MNFNFEKWQKNDVDGKYPIDCEITKELLAETDIAASQLKEEILSAQDKVANVGKSFYISDKGCDCNDGLSPQTPWKTLSKLEKSWDIVSDGDGIFLERGSFFRGRIVCQKSVTVAAYGKGKKPVVCGSAENGAYEYKWSLVDGTDNIWLYYKKICDVGVIVFDDLDSTENFVDSDKYSFKYIPSFCNGEFVCREDASQKFDVKKHIKRNLGHFNECKSVLNSLGNPVPNRDNLGNLYLRCDQGNPGKVFRSIEFAESGNILRATKSNTHFDNLEIIYGGCHGLGCGTIKGLHVTNCVFKWIGGCVQAYKSPEKGGEAFRFGNAIEIYGGCDDYVCDHNYIYQAYDAGITHQLSAGGTRDCIQKNIVYSCNLIEFCTYSIEYFLGRADVIEAVRFQSNIKMFNNIMRYCGFGFGEQRPTLENYYPAAHIKGWDHANPLDQNFEIRNNIFDRARNMIIHSNAAKKEWLPHYDGNIYIQHKNSPHGTLGKYGALPCIAYDEKLRENMNSANLDENAGVYYCSDDVLLSLDDFSPKVLIYSR